MFEIESVRSFTAAERRTLGSPAAPRPAVWHRSRARSRRVRELRAAEVVELRRAHFAAKARLESERERRVELYASRAALGLCIFTGKPRASAEDPENVEAELLADRVARLAARFVAAFGGVDRAARLAGYAPGVVLRWLGGEAPKSQREMLERWAECNPAAASAEAVTA